MAPRITQRDLARELGVDISTVSKALKNHPAVSARTKQQVREAAQRLGYRPDPMLTSLAAYRRNTRTIPFQSVLAWVYNHSAKRSMEAFPDYEDFELGASQRAEELGYRLEVFWLKRRGPMTPTRLGDVLRARGIQGVLLPPQAEVGRPLSLPWESFASVALGHSLPGPRLHRVSNDHVFLITQLLDTLRARGYRRIGYDMWAQDNLRTEQRVLAALMTHSQTKSVPIRVYEQFQPKEFLAWVRQHRLDAVVVRDVRAQRALERAGYLIPDQCGVVYVTMKKGDTSKAGFSHNNWQLGATAVELVANHLQNGRLGLPDHPWKIHLESLWQEGPTLRALA